jgi:hypothetical protein
MDEISREHILLHEVIYQAVAASYAKPDGALARDKIAEIAERVLSAVQGDPTALIAPELRSRPPAAWAALLVRRTLPGLTAMQQAEAVTAELLAVDKNRKPAQILADK